LRVPSGEAETFADRIAAMEIPGELKSAVAPLLALFESLNAQIAFSDQAIAAATARDELVAKLRTAPGVGPVTAAAFRALVDDPARFRGAHQVESYIGLVPSEMSSGEKQRKGRITKTGNGRMRWLLVQAAHGILRSKSLETLSLREWARRLEARRGRNVALVALARKLAGILFAMMRDGRQFDHRLTAADRNRSSAGKAGSKEGERVFALGRSARTAVAQMAPPPSDAPMRRRARHAR
jgi:transposase